MPADMKETIAKATLTLLTDRHVKKLTVKSIVEQCHITRQAFYYHFEDICELFRWMLEKRAEQMLQEILSKGDAEEGLRCFFVMAIHFVPYVRRGMDSSHGGGAGGDAAPVYLPVFQHGGRAQRILCAIHCRRSKNHLPLSRPCRLRPATGMDGSGYGATGSNRPHGLPPDDNGNAAPNLGRASCQKSRSVKIFYTPGFLSIQNGNCAN